MIAKQAVIIGAGPAGLTAAFELLDRTDITPVVIEMSDHIGGISRTVNYKGNRIDLGGHRFFSKSDRVMEWWLRHLPLERLTGDATVTYHRQSRCVQSPADAPDPQTADRVMLLRRRKSRIYFLRKFFDYPLQFNARTVANLGLTRIAKIGASYAWSAMFARKNPANLEEFFVGRFGRELYRTFFKSYTEKVWGVPCSEISAEWGAQRIKGLSIRKALGHFLKSALRPGRDGVRQEGTETSLIEQFLYPKFGPGQMWETVADAVRRRGGKVVMKQRVTKLRLDRDRVTAVDAVDVETSQEATYRADYVFSSMPVKELIGALDKEIPGNVQEVADGLMYRDFITVGLLVRRLKVREKDGGADRPISDNWIYVQEPDVKLGRLQIFNNWSPYMVADPATTWLGLEYFCYESDELWNLPDGELIEMAKGELARIGILDVEEVLDATVLRMPKTYPAYFGSYNRFGEVQAFVDEISNLFLVGRNGMHKYNNQDHSVLTAMTAVDNIVAGRRDRSNIWDVNAEQEYHEDKQA